MSKVTYTTRLSTNHYQFCAVMGELFGVIERNLYQDLIKGISLTKLKKEYQLTYQIKARQFNSIYFNLKGKITSRQEGHQGKINDLKSRIKGLETSIKTKIKNLKKLFPACGINGAKTLKQQLKFEIHQKKRKLFRLKLNLEKLQASNPTLIFGTKKRLKAQFNLEASGYKNHEEWLKDWRSARSGNFIYLGSSDEKNGNQNCQLSCQEDKLNLSIRVPYALENEFGSYIKCEDINFKYGAENLLYALRENRQLTYRFYLIKGIWYLACTVDLPEIPYQSNKINGAIGLDINPNVIGWSYCDNEGNLKAKGQIKYNLRDRSSDQVKATIGDIAKEIINKASQYQCPVVVENLDFSKKRAAMKEKGVKYSRMLSNFAYSKIIEMLVVRGEKYGIEIIKVNPAYSSLIGLTKYMKMYGLSSDTAAALVLGRRYLRLSERIPAVGGGIYYLNQRLSPKVLIEDCPHPPKYALLVKVNTNKHVWSFWNKLSKKLSGKSRHSFFGGTNSSIEVNLVDELSEQSGSRSVRKSSDASKPRRESLAQVDNTVRSATDESISSTIFI